MLKKIYSWGILTLERERNYISEQLVSISLLGTQPAEVTAKINTRFSYAATDLFPHTQFKQNSWEQRYRFDSAPYSTYPTERIQNNKNIYILKGERYISYVFPQNWNSYSLFWWNWILKVFKWCTQLPKYIHCTLFAVLSVLISLIIGKKEVSIFHTTDLLSTARENLLSSLKLSQIDWMWQKDPTVHIYVICPLKYSAMHRWGMLILFCFWIFLFFFLLFLLNSISLS